jgi:hypothetical protein
MWFTEQFGKCPGGNKSRQRLVREYDNAYKEYMQAKNVLEAFDLYHKQETAALYAWTAMQGIWDDNKET